MRQPRGGRLTCSGCACGCAQVGSVLRVGGWVKTGRAANKDAFAFLEVNDGSTPVNLQARAAAAPRALASRARTPQRLGLRAHMSPHRLAR
jgi:hypothetical protein